MGRSTGTGCSPWATRCCLRLHAPAASHLPWFSRHTARHTGLHARQQARLLTAALWQIQLHSGKCNCTSSLPGVEEHGAAGIAILRGTAQGVTKTVSSLAPLPACSSPSLCLRAGW